jgi:hypothetical protein
MVACFREEFEEFKKYKNGWSNGVLGDLSPFLYLRDKAHFLELAEKAEQHFFGIDPFQKTVSARFARNCKNTS